MSNYRKILAAIFSFLLVALGVIISWACTWATYQLWTSGGSIFGSSGVEIHDAEKLRNTNISSWDNLYTREYSDRGQYVSYKVFVGNQFVVEISTHLNPVQTESGETHQIWWKYGGGDTKDNMSTLFGIGPEGDNAEIYLLKKGAWFTPFTRQVWIGIPSGSFSPVINKAIKQGITAAGLSIEEKYLKAFSTRISQEIRSDLQVDGIYKRLDQYISKFGPVQFATVWLFYFFCYLIIVSFWFEWGKLGAEMASGLIPFVGFFGTLLGMAGALGILGSTDLSDPVSKSINLGPIGSELGFAIRTTIFAFIFYALSFVIYIIRIAVYENETYVVLNRGGGILSKYVIRLYRFIRGLRYSINKSSPSTKTS